MRFPSIQELYAVYKNHPVITTDSRKIPAGSVFFSLRGDSFDGNRFAGEALKQGASYAVIDDEKQYKGEPYILVNDCLKTLQELAGYHRKQLKIPFVAITGSNGKTTTKELINKILSKKYKTLATTGNLNNHIGVPLTLLSVQPEMEIAIIEMGANHVGEIKFLCEMARPGFGLITNVGRAHIGEFGSFENIVKTKAELYDFIRDHGGKIFINSANELLMSRSGGIEKISYGTSGSDFCRCMFESSDPFLKINFENETITSRLVGKYNFENVAAAVCIGKYFGVEPGKIKEAIEAYEPSNNRSQIIKTDSNTIILDAYNANPSSMRAALENFRDMKGGPKWLILGDMLELGEYEIEEHKNILRLISEMKIRNVILVGDRFSKASSELNAGHTLFKTSEELAVFLRTHSPIGKNNLVLIKGSRGIKLEKAAEFL